MPAGGGAPTRQPARLAGPRLCNQVPDPCRFALSRMRRGPRLRCAREVSRDGGERGLAWHAPALQPASGTLLHCAGYLSLPSHFRPLPGQGRRQTRRKLPVSTPALPAGGPRLPSHTPLSGPRLPPLPPFPETPSQPPQRAMTAGRHARPALATSGPAQGLQAWPDGLRRSRAEVTSSRSPVLPALVPLCVSRACRVMKRAPSSCQKRTR